MGTLSSFCSSPWVLSCSLLHWTVPLHVIVHHFSLLFNCSSVANMNNYDKLTACNNQMMFALLHLLSWFPSSLKVIACLGCNVNFGNLEAKQSNSFLNDHKMGACCQPQTFLLWWISRCPLEVIPSASLAVLAALPFAPR